MEHSKWGHLEFGDFNGDGLTDILNLDKDGCRLLQSNGMGKLNLATVAIWPTSKHHIHTGDFNGDGKTDLLLTGYDDDPNSGGWSEWCIYYSLGNGSFQTTTSLSTHARHCCSLPTSMATASTTFMPWTVNLLATT